MQQTTDRSRPQGEILHPAASGPEGRAVPLRQLASDAHRIKELCDLLEALADDLPRRSPAVWREASRLSSTVLPRHFQAVSTVLLPCLSETASESVVTRPALAQLQRDFDDCTACLPELSDLLEQASGTGPSDLPSEAVGYALRCFFAEIRRQIAWEEAVVLPLAFETCRPVDLDLLGLWLVSHPAPPMRTGAEICSKVKA